MEKTRTPTERRVRESELRLRDLDDLIALAREISAREGEDMKTEPLLRNIELAQRGLLQYLDRIRRQCPVGRKEIGIKRILETVGLQLDGVLGAVFKRDRQRMR
jgi:hypothetical protein